MNNDLQRKTPPALSMGTVAGPEEHVVQIRNRPSVLARTSSWRKFSSVFNFLLAVPPLALFTTWIYLQGSPDSSRIVEVLSDMLIFLEK